MKNVKFRGKKTNSASNSAGKFRGKKPKFPEIPRTRKAVGPTSDSRPHIND